MIEKNARDVAILAITAHRKREAWSEGFLRNEIKKCRLSQRDAALATEIVNGVLQNKLLINYYIKKFSSIRFNKIAPGILDILQLAIYQILFLDRVPDFAAVNDAVVRAKRNNPRAAAFVNALTRKISAQKEELPPIEGTKQEILSVTYSHPLELVELLVSVYGENETEKILGANNKKTASVVRVNTLKTSETELLKQSEKNNITLKKGEIENSLLISFDGSIEGDNRFKNGLFYVQDTASQLAAKALSPKPGERVLDACAAPGGKSFLMAQLMENTGEIISCDVYEHKLKLIEDGAKRLGISNIKTFLCDAKKYSPSFDGVFDKILADVPCSGLGIIRKKPDIRYKSCEEIKNLPELQLNILKNVSRYLKPGGELLYSTCTILPRENGEIIKAFLSENKNFETVPFSLEVSAVDDGFGKTLLPHISKTDGFYISKLRRVK